MEERCLSDKAETPANMLCLSSNVHQYWTKGLLALKPIELSPDRTQLAVQFFWLDRETRERNRVSLLEAPDQISNLGDDSPGNNGEIELWNCRTRAKIRSGDLVILKTDDPNQCPLPDWDLMEMQWYVQIIVALAGAREGGDSWEPRESDDDTDDSDNNLSDDDPW